MCPTPSIVWFRQDLRLDDNPALQAALRREGALIPVYVWDPQAEAGWVPGSASRWWLHQSLRSFDNALRQRGSRLILRQGNAVATLQALVRDTGAEAVFWNRRYEPAARSCQASVETAMRQQGLRVESCNGNLLFEPWEVLNKQGNPFRVFTSFWKACLSLPVPSEPVPAPGNLPAPARWPQSLRLDRFELEPKIDRAAGIRAVWRPGEEGACEQVQRFLEDALAAYPEERHRPDLYGSSRLSPHLHMGEVSPRRVWHRIQQHLMLDRRTDIPSGADAYLRQLGWREFAYHLLYHLPHTTDTPLRESFNAFPWRNDPDALRVWQMGRTGYPLVDAGMRELWATGWMHNRVRMVAASFLVKHLLIAWQHGARWFWDTLVDADLANNTLGWQWTAGCGADAAPYFRIFNPVRQGQKFDPRGDYLRRWLPELGAMPASWIHKPWEAPRNVLTAAGVTLGQTYAAPMVDHHMARHRALAALETIRQPSGEHLSEL